MAHKRKRRIVICAICLLLGFAFGSGTALFRDSSQSVIAELQAELEQQERASTNHAAELQAANDLMATLTSELQQAKVDVSWAQEERDSAIASLNEAESKQSAARDGNALAVEVKQLKNAIRYLSTAVSALESKVSISVDMISRLRKQSPTSNRKRVAATVRDSSELETVPDVRHLLSSGNGRDWMRLSGLERMRLCELIANTSGKHTMWYYHAFLSSLYERVESREMDIAKAAAVAEAMDLESEQSFSPPISARAAHKGG